MPTAIGVAEHPMRLPRPWRTMWSIGSGSQINLVQIIIARIWQMAREGIGVLGIPRRCHSPPLLEVQEAVFHQMPQLVQRPVIFPLFPPVALGRYHRIHSPFRGCVYDFIGVIGLVCQKMLRRDTLNQGQRLGAVAPPCLR